MINTELIWLLGIPPILLGIASGVMAIAMLKTAIEHSNIIPFWLSLITGSLSISCFIFGAIFIL